MTDFPTDAFGLIRRQSALAHDFTDDHLVAAERAGDILRLAPGSYYPSGDDVSGPEGEDLLYRMRSIAVATSERDGGQLTLSHAAAAAMHDLPLLKPARELVHFTSGSASGGYIRSHRHVHAGILSPTEIEQVKGLLVTSVARTAVDVACSGDFAQALVVFDSALRKGADRTEMEAILARRRRGARPARRALALADGLSESVGESWSRAQMIDANLPIPLLQRKFRWGAKEYRTDFHWVHGLVGEFDGMTKYGRLRKPGESLRDALIREKQREDELRALDLMVLRWTWAMLERGEVIGLLLPWLVRLGAMVA